MLNPPKPVVAVEVPSVGAAVDLAAPLNKEELPNPNPADVVVVAAGLPKALEPKPNPVLLVLTGAVAGAGNLNAMIVFTQTTQPFNDKVLWKK